MRREVLTRIVVLQHRDSRTNGSRAIRTAICAQQYPCIVGSAQPRVTRLAGLPRGGKARRTARYLRVRFLN